MTWVLVAGTADWRQQIATNQHYMVRELARDHRVTFTESIGLRSVRLNRSDLSRVRARIRGARIDDRPERDVPVNVDVRSPKLVPVHSRSTRLLNRALFSRYWSDWAAYDGAKILWTYTPLLYGAEKVADRIVYHCVDLLREVDGISAALIDSSERSLARQGDVVAIGTSRPVAENLKRNGFAAPVLWPNVADTAQHSAYTFSAVRVKRRAIFAGNLTSQKVDFELLRAVAKSGVDLHLAGPVPEQDRAAVDSLRDVGATYHGHLEPDGLARLSATATVGLIPYWKNRYTTGVSPLKTYEYLASGLFVLSIGAPTVEPSQHVETVGAKEDFVEQARIRSAGLPSELVLAERVAFAAGHSWERRGEQARELVSNLSGFVQ